MQQTKIRAYFRPTPYSSSSSCSFFSSKTRTNTKCARRRSLLWDIYSAGLIDHHRPGMIDLAVLNIRKRFAYQLMHGLLLLHGGYEQILAQIVNAIDGANNAGSAGAEELEQLSEESAEELQLVLDSGGGLSRGTYASLVEQIGHLGHGKDGLTHLELAPLACHGQDGVACNAGQYETIQWRRDQFLFWKKKEET